MLQYGHLHVLGMLSYLHCSLVWQEPDQCQYWLVMKTCYYPKWSIVRALISLLALLASICSGVGSGVGCLTLLLQSFDFFHSTIGNYNIHLPIDNLVFLWQSSEFFNDAIGHQNVAWVWKHIVLHVWTEIFLIKFYQLHRYMMGLFDRTPASQDIELVWNMIFNGEHIHHSIHCNDPSGEYVPHSRVLWRCLLYLDRHSHRIISSSMSGSLQKTIICPTLIMWLLCR
jgi:hypothetical protein